MTDRSVLFSSRTRYCNERNLSKWSRWWTNGSCFQCIRSNHSSTRRFLSSCCSSSKWIFRYCKKLRWIDFLRKFVLVSKLDFIYSNQFTVEQVQEKPSKKRKRIPCLERLSYKVLCQRLIDQHDERSNNYENKISDIETK